MVQHIVEPELNLLRALFRWQVRGEGVELVGLSPKEVAGTESNTHGHSASPSASHGQVVIRLAN